ncbi:helix-turn-helix domain-containing protein [Pedobacter westerhofensis]|uniref:helix-turn-helix domain-containing protein n=1 Tax=Pedobacter westerhofensis TaxID=425512 RepID=UPI00115C0960|nr:helix-turn-helix domain-containing protein [Pedobacter westerhofensis]
MNDEIKTRLNWMQLYLDIGNAGIVCRKCGISRPTLRKWLNCYKELGIEGLNELSKRPRKKNKSFFRRRTKNN